MRFRRLEVSGFRGFPDATAFDLDADAIILAGLNGSGKTSFFDAALWALCGSVDRLADDQASIVSAYSTTGEARVELTLGGRNDSRVRVVRRFDGAMHLSVWIDEGPPATGVAAEAALLDLLWPDAKSASDPRRALARSLTRAIYLQQDLVRQFVDADDEATRFQVVGELVGAGRIGELQRQLESSRNAWARATTALRKELEPVAERRRAIANHLERLVADPRAGDPRDAVRNWLREVESTVGLRALGEQGGTPSDVDRVMRELASLEAQVARAADTARRLAAHQARRPEAPPDVQMLRARVLEAEARQRAASESLKAVQSAAAVRRQEQVMQSELKEELRVLAQLALKHLGDRCPVCAQHYDEPATRARLTAYIDAPSGVSDQSLESPPDVASAAAALRDAELHAAEARTALREGEVSAARHEEWAATLDALKAQLAEQATSATVGADTHSVPVLDSQRAKIQDLTARGEDISLQIARAAELSQRDELARSLEMIETRHMQMQREILEREATSNLASQVINALRDADSAVVSKELQRIGPLLQRIFAAVDPHPTFRLVSLLTKTTRGKGRIWATLDDATNPVDPQEPGLVLSSSQLNVLAVAVFLAFNLAIPTLPLQLIALDDPLQSLDTINLLGLTDLLRRAGAERQVIVSTHDDRLAGLLERKLRPVGDGSRTVRIDLSDWTASGPRVQQRDVPGDAPGLRLVRHAS